MKRDFRYAGCLLTLLALMALAAGCSTAPVATLDNPLKLAVSDRDLLRNGINDVLQTWPLFFVVESPPRSPELVNTEPLVSAYTLECWRGDTRTSDDKIETALHTVRRTVTVKLTPVEAKPAAMMIEVVVVKERLNLPQSVSATSVTEAYGVFESRVKVLDAFEQQFGIGTHWIDFGRDADLEQYILQQIRARF